MSDYKLKSIIVCVVMITLTLCSFYFSSGWAGIGAAVCLLHIILDS